MNSTSLPCTKTKRNHFAGVTLDWFDLTNLGWLYSNLSRLVILKKSHCEYVYSLWAWTNSTNLDWLEYNQSYSSVENTGKTYLTSGFRGRIEALWASLFHKGKVSGYGAIFPLTRYFLTFSSDFHKASQPKSDGRYTPCFDWLNLD